MARMWYSMFQRHAEPRSILSTRFSDSFEKSKSIWGFPIILQGNKHSSLRPSTNDAGFMGGEIRKNVRLTLCAMVAKYHHCEPVLLFKYVNLN